MSDNIIIYICGLIGALGTSMMSYILGRKRRTISITKEMQDIYQDIIDDLKNQIKDLKIHVREVEVEFDRKIKTITQTIISKDRIIQEQIIRMEMQDRNLKNWENGHEKLKVIIQDKTKVIGQLQKEIDEK